MDDDFSSLAKMLAEMPAQPYPDWDGTNHYEVHSDEDYFWFCIDESIKTIKRDNEPTAIFIDSQSEAGKRLGLLLNIASLTKRLHDKGKLNDNGNNKINT